jgi:hypothetical protein
MKRRVLVAMAVAFLCGCARARITTEIKADGSWKRTVALTAPKAQEGMQVPSLENTFVTPSGSRWKSHEETEKNQERWLVSERMFAGGESSEGDLSIKGADPSKLKLVNKVTVSRLGPHRFEYRETLQWKGERPESLNPTPDEMAAFQACLPKPLATEANARALLDKESALILPVLFGPSDPVLPLVIVHPDLAERRLAQRTDAQLVKLLEEQFGDKMAPSERREVARKFIELGVSMNRPSQPQASPASPPTSSKAGSLVPLLFIVKVPGRVVSTNGEVDEDRGEVYWGLFDVGAAAKALVLTTVCDTEAR